MFLLQNVFFSTFRIPQTAHFPFDQLHLEGQGAT